MKVEWKRLMLAGVRAETPKYLEISLLFTNIVQALILTTSLAWAMISLFAFNLLILALVHSVIALVSLSLMFTMHKAFNSRAIRVATVFLLVFYFSFINLFIGPRTGVEFFAPIVLFATMILLPSDGDPWAKPVRLFSVLALAGSLISLFFTSPLIPIDEKTLNDPSSFFIGYQINVFLVFVCSYVLSRVMAFQMAELITETNKEKTVAFNALQESEGRYRRAARLTRMGHWLWDEVEDKCVYCSEEMAEIYGVTVSEYIRGTKNRVEEVTWFHEDDRENALQVIEQAAANKTGYELKLRVVRRDGEVRHIQKVTDAVLSDDGRHIQTVGVLRDVTEAMTVEEAIRRTQKMEALSQLTGGVAHDFNNILGIILGNAELLEWDSIADEAAKRKIQTIRQSTERAAILTERLLKFSRPHPIQVVTSNVNRLINDLENLIAGSMTPEVDISYLLTDGLWHVNVNPGDFEDCVINLVLNARDAMPSGGSLEVASANRTFETEFCRDNPEYTIGDYVEISVTDSGSGISDANLEHIFEPFFTTKETGKGTGLGLAMVYGFISRSQGFVTVDSIKGSGTSFNLYVPKADLVDLPIEPEVRTDEPIPKGSATLLVVDDEEYLLESVTILLKKLGYRVLTANSASEALVVLQREPAIEMLFSDLVMPGGINGYELAEKAVELRPDLKVLITSGYSGKTMAKDNQNKFSLGVLHKPYSYAELALAIRDRLEQAQPVS